jgi:hypothetical protein
MSERLRLREFRDSDLDVLAAMVGDDEQTTFYPRPHPTAGARGSLRGRDRMARSQALLKSGHRHGGSHSGLQGGGDALWHLAPHRLGASRPRRLPSVAENVGMRIEGTTVLDGDYPAIVYAAELLGRASGAQPDASAGAARAARARAKTHVRRAT